MVDHERKKKEKRKPDEGFDDFLDEAKTKEV